MNSMAVVEGVEVPVREGDESGGLHLRLAEVAVLLQPVARPRAADDRVAVAPEPLRVFPEPVSSKTITSAHST
jgi:hypothetical protein